MEMGSAEATPKDGGDKSKARVRKAREARQAANDKDRRAAHVALAEARTLAGIVRWERDRC